MHRAVSGAAAVVVALMFVQPATAAMVLTAAGTSQGFSLSTVVSGIPNGGSLGPIGVVVTPTNQLLVNDFGFNGQTYRFSNVDNQTFASGTLVPNPNGVNAFAMTVAQGNVYAYDISNGRIVQLNNDGTFNHVVRSISGLGLTTNPTNGHLLFASGGVVDIDPTNGNLTVIENTTSFDGISTDGTVVYGAGGPGIVGYNLVTHAQVFSAGVGGGPDGTAIGTGSLAGKLFVNTNGGQVIEIDLATNSQTVIATGGSRGDFVYVDPNGSLLLTQTDSVLRLTPQSGGGFLAVEAPEPASIMMLGAGVACAMGYGWRRRKSSV